MNRCRENTRNPNHSSISDRAILEPILIIEDSPSVGQLLKEKLVNRWHCDVHLASSYAEAKSYLKQHRHDLFLAICDLNLPDAPDGEIIDLVKRADVRCLAMSGCFGDELRQMMSEKGVADYIIKDSINAYDYLVDQVGRLYRNQYIEVLVVDDSEIQRELLLHVLSIQNYQVHTAANGIEALEILNEQPDIRLIVTDYVMPDMDGFKLTIEARKSFDRSKLAIIGVSGKGYDELGVQFIKHGANDFLMKPFLNEEIVCRINQNLDLLGYIDTISNLANRDSLTQLYNRRYFFVEGGMLVNSNCENQTESVLAFVDIDDFKHINDTYGHKAGDKVLIHFATLLSELFKNDLVARIGGEEFVILVSEGCKAEAIEKLEIFIKTVEGNPVVANEHDISMTASIGFDCSKSRNIDQMLGFADENLYKAKAAGKNRITGDSIASELAS